VPYVARVSPQAEYITSPVTAPKLLSVIAVELI